MTEEQISRIEEELFVIEKDIKNAIDQYRAYHDTSNMNAIISMHDQIIRLSNQIIGARLVLEILGYNLNVDDDGVVTMTELGDENGV